MSDDHKTHYNLSDGDKEHELNTKLTAAADFQGPIKVRTDGMTSSESDGRGHEACTHKTLEPYLNWVCLSTGAQVHGPTAHATAAGSVGCHDGRRHPGRTEGKHQRAETGVSHHMHQS